MERPPVIAIVWNEPQAMNRIRLPFKPSTIFGASLSFCKLSACGSSQYRKD
jgi:hypothetical protein